MIRLETEELILRHLQKNETALGGSCCLSASVFDYGGREGCFAVVSRESRKIVGTILCPEEELTVFIAENSRDLGFGADGLALALDALFGILGREKVTALCEKNNLPAVKMLLHCGMEPIKEENTLLHWALTREEWERI